MKLTLLILTTLSSLTTESPGIIWTTHPTPKIKTPSWVPPDNPTLPWPIITNYLSTSSSPTITAQTLVQLPPSNPAGNHTLHIFKSILEIAIQIPHIHPWHQQLATLLSEIKVQPPPPLEAVRAFRNSTIYQNQYSIRNFTWSDLQTLRIITSESYMSKNRISLTNRKQFSGTSPMWATEEWLSFNHFIALLVARDIVPSINFAKTGLMVLGSTVEQKMGRRKEDVAFLEDNIPSAAIWILSAGRWMREYEGEDLVIEYKTFYGEEIEPRKREWGIWEERFWEVSGRGDLNFKTRQWALKAGFYMRGEGRGL